MDAHKSEVLSINLRSADFLQTEHESEEAWELREGLKEMNASWDRLGASLEDWREELQGVLMQCQVLKTHIHTLFIIIPASADHHMSYFSTSARRSSMR